MSNWLGQLIISMGVDSKGLGAAYVEVDKLGKKTQATSAMMTAALNNAGRSMQYFGWYASMYLTAPITLFGKTAFTAAKDFEWSMTKIIGLVGESKRQVGSWGQDIMKLGPALGASPKQLAEGLYFITSSGFSGADAMDILQQSTKAAATGLGDVNKIADFTTSALNAYADSGLTASKVMDVLVAAVREGKLEASGFTNQIGQVIPVASAMGVRFEELAASLAAMSLTGTNASEGVVYLRGILNALLDPASEAGTALRDMGLSAEGLRKTIKEEGLLVALKQINDRTKIYGESLVSKVIPNVRAMTGFMSLMGENYEKNLSIFREVSASTGSMNKAFEAVTNTIQYKWNQAIATSQASLIKIGMELKDSLLPMLDVLIKILSKVADWFANLSDPVQKLITYMAAFLAIIGPLSAGLGFIVRYLLPAMKVGFASIVGVLSNPIFVFIAAAIAGIAISLKGSGEAARQAAEEQKKLNAEYEKTKEYQQTTASINSMLAVADKMNKAQLSGLMQRIESEIKMIEDQKVAELAAEKEKQVKISKYIEDARAVGEKALYEGIVAAQDASRLTGKVYKEEKEQEIVQAQVTADQQIKILQSQLQAAKALYDKMKDPTEITGKDPAIAEAMKNMTMQEQVIKGMTPIMKEAGKEWDENAKLSSLYENTLETLLPYLSQASSEIEIVKNKMNALGSSTSKINKIFDELNSELAYIQMMGSLGWGEDEMNKASLDAYSQGLEKAVRSQQASSSQLASLQENVSLFYDKVYGLTAIMKALDTEMEMNSFMSSILGQTYDTASANVGSITNAIQNLHSLFTTGKIGIYEYITALSIWTEKLKDAQVQQQAFANKLQVTNGFASMSAQLFTDMGTAFVTGAKGMQGAFSNILKGLQQIINSLLVSAIASTLDGSMKTTKNPIAGLALAAVSIAALIALFDSQKNKASGAAHMKTGGVVPGGYPNDTYPAMLTSGETVLPPGELPRGNTVVLVGETKLKKGDIYIAWKQYGEHLERVN